MPTYEYECLECRYRFDVFQSMKDNPLEICEKCGGRVKRLIGSGSGIIFKGSGFYVNDYRGGSATSSKSKSESQPKETAPEACASCAKGEGCPSQS